MRNATTKTWNVLITKYKISFTVFIRLSALGAYLIFGPSGWALIRGGRLFEAGRLFNFHHFQQRKGLFCNKTINNNKT